MIKRLFLLTICLSIAIFTSAQDLKLPPILQGDVVLQQSAEAGLWGKAQPKQKVTVVTSWNKKEYVATSDAMGNWAVKVTTPQASFTEYTVTIKSKGETLTLPNVLIGDVWLCSGQSNMEMPMKGMYNCHVEGAPQDIALAGSHKGLRFITVARVTGKTEIQQEFTEGSWVKSTPATASDMSATAFYFGRMLSESLTIPIGILNCSYSGSWVEDWIPESVISQFKDDSGSRWKTQFYYGMMQPNNKYTFKGMIWYQGESNVGNTDYDYRLATAVDFWRNKVFDCGEFPFYMVEIAPYDYTANGRINKLAPGNAPFLREQQYKSTKIIPNSGIITTNDLVYPEEIRQIHPRQKEAVGERLAMLALSQTYGYGQLAKGPEYKAVRFDEGAGFVQFDNMANGIMNAGEIIGFEIAGEDRVFYPATATYSFGFGPRNGASRGPEMKVVSDKVSNPVAVRYCFQDFLVGNLKNVEGFAAYPFRTDNWPYVSMEEKEAKRQADRLAAWKRLRPTEDKWSNPTGQYAVVMEVDPTFPEHTIYRPADMSAFNGKNLLPVVLMQGPGCNVDGDSFRPFWTELASYGYIVMAPGEPLKEGEFGATFTTNTDDNLEALEWITKEAKRPDSKYFGRVDVNKVAVMGQSCGGIQALRMADMPCVKTIVFWNSASVLMGNIDAVSTNRILKEAPNDLMGNRDLKKLVMSLKIPIAYFVGDGAGEVPAASGDFQDITKAPVFYGQRVIPGDAHGGTFREKNGGAFGVVGVAWLEYVLKGNKEAKKMFVGKNATILSDPDWKEVKYKNLK